MFVVPVSMKHQVDSLLLCVSQIHWHRRFATLRWRSPSCSLDGTHRPIQEPRLPSGGVDRNYYSHKLNGAALAYEIALALDRSEIVYAGGGLPASIPDIALARKHFTAALARGEKALADKGYRDGNVNFLTPDDCEWTERRLHKRVMARHETVNSRLASFNVMSQKFRHRSDAKHQLCFFACINLIQLMLKEEPLMDGL